MGISGLLPFLEKASKPSNIKEYSGCTVAVDTYCWLHKGAFSCAEKLARGESTDQYVVYCMKFVNLLLSHNIKPIMVFDGRHLPAKADTEKTRKERRELNRKKAAELLRAERLEEARSLIRRCVDVTHEMASALIDRCRSAGVDCIVAPYEADAQLAFFSITNVAQVIITEDSDLLLFGCKKVMFKMDALGNGLLVDQCLIPLAMKMPVDQFSLDKFIYMCILSGCDYLPSLPGIGLAKAFKFIKRTADDDIYRALNRLAGHLNMKNLVVTQEYKDKFKVAVSMFKYQPVYNPFKRKLSTLNPLPSDEKLPVDEGLSSETCLQLALGNLNPFSLVRTNNWDPDDPKNYKSINWNTSARKNSIWSSNYEVTKQFVQKKNVTTFDKYVKRIEKPVSEIKRTSCIEEVRSPQKKNIEEELSNLRNLYGVKSKKDETSIYFESLETSKADTTFIGEDDFDDDLFDKDKADPNLDNSIVSKAKNPFAANSDREDHSESLLTLMSKFNSTFNENNGEVRSGKSITEEINLKNSEECDFNVDDLFGKDELTPNLDSSMINHNTKNPFATSSKKKDPTTPLLARISKFNSTFNENNGQVSRYFSDNSAAEELDTSLKTSQVSPTNEDNILKNIINTPTKKLNEKLTSKDPVIPAATSKDPVTPAATRRNIFSSSPSNKNSELELSNSKISPGRPSFLRMLDTMVSPKKDEQVKIIKEETPLKKKQTKLIFTDSASSSQEILSDRENTEPVKITALVKTLPAKIKSSPSPSPSPRSQKRPVSWLGPAKTIGLKRKKSINNDPKQSQPSIFDMFSFQPKTKLKMQ